MRNAISNTTADLKSAWSVQRSSGATNIFLGYGGSAASATAAGAGTVFRETGTTIPAADPSMIYTTRRMYQAGFANEWRGDEIYGYVGSYTGTPLITYIAQNTKTDDAGPIEVYRKTITLGGQKLHQVSPRAMFGGLRSLRWSLPQLCPRV
jgi:hypothetical protein